MFKTSNINYFHCKHSKLKVNYKYSKNLSPHKTIRVLQKDTKVDFQGIKTVGRGRQLISGHFSATKDFKYRNISLQNQKSNTIDGIQN